MNKCLEALHQSNAVVVLFILALKSLGHKQIRLRLFQNNWVLLNLLINIFSIFSFLVDSLARI